MRLIDRYLAKELLISAMFAVCTLSLVLVLGQIFKKVFEFIVEHNVPVSYIITFIAYFLPFSLILSIPWGLLTAVLLVFGRLSAGNELTALRTAGLSIWRISRPVMFLAVVFSGVCLWINLYVAPRAQQNLKQAFVNVATSNPEAVFSGDTVITEFPNKRIYVGRKTGNQLENIHVFDLLPNNKPVRVIFASMGRLEIDSANKQINMRLEGCRYEQRDFSQPDDLTKIRDGNTMGSFVFPISLDDLFTQKQGRRKVEWYTYEELKDDLQRRRAQLKADRAKFKENPDDQLKRSIRVNANAIAAGATELNRRFSYSLACVTFALIGIPLGITAHRQETTAGFALSLVVAFLYFAIIIYVNTIRERADLHPELLIWLPNVIFLILGAVLFFRLSRR